MTRSRSSRLPSTRTLPLVIASSGSSSPFSRGLNGSSLMSTALEQAKKAAAGKDVVPGRRRYVARQYLAAG